MRSLALTQAALALRLIARFRPAASPPSVIALYVRKARDGVARGPPAGCMGSNVESRHFPPCAGTMGAPVPEMQLMADALLAQEVAEVAVVVEERVVLADR